MAGDILTTEQVEALHIMDSEAPAAKLVAAKMRGIVMNLMSESNVPNLANIDYILVDSDKANAFYIPPKGTTNGREALGVTTELIKMCRNEDELAGVLAHEMGHFVYEKLLKGKNTLPQERAADLHALDLLLDGGYNPENYEGLAQRLFLDDRQHSGIWGAMESVGVHGSPYARVEDIRAYLTILDLKHGRGATGPSEEWQAFQLEFDGALTAGRFQSYLDKLLAGTDDNEERLRRVLDNLFDLNIDPRVRDLNGKLDEWHKALGYNVELSPGAMAVSQNLAVAVYNRAQADPDGIWATGRETYYQWNSVIIRTLARFRGRPLDMFGEFSEYAAARRQFIDAETPEIAASVAEKYSAGQLERLEAYAAAFDMPDFAPLPEIKNAVGHELSYAKHLRWAKDNEDIKQFMLGAFHRKPELLEKYRDNERFPFDNGGSQSFQYRDAYLEDGVIVAVDDEAREMERHRSDREWLRGHIAGNRKILERKAALLDAFADLESGELDMYGEYDNHDTRMLYLGGQYYFDVNITQGHSVLGSFFNDGYHSLSDNSDAKEAAADLAMLRDAKGFYLLDGKIPFSDEIIAELGGKLKPGDEIKMMTSPGVNIGATRRVAEILSKAAVGPNGRDRANLFSHIYDAVRDVSLAKSLGGTKQHADFSKELSDELNEKIFANMESEKTKIMEKIRDDFANAAEPSEFFDALDYRMGLRDEALAGKTEHLDAAIAKLIGKMPKTQAELVAAVGVIWNDNDIFRNRYGYNDSDRRNPTRDRAIAFLIWRWLETGGKITDLAELVKSANIELRDMHFLKDTMADAIAVDGLFPASPAEAIPLYAEMDRWGWFSEHRSNQSAVLGTILRQLETASRADREKYSLMLLTGEYGGAAAVRKSASMSFPVQKKALCEMFANAVRERIGLDDDSEKYRGQLRKIMDALDRPAEFLEYYGDKGKRARMNLPDRQIFFRVLSDVLETQFAASDMMKSGQELAVGDEDAQKLDGYAQSFEVLLAGLQDQKGVSAAFDFLNNPLTQESMDKYRENMKKFGVVHPSDIENRFSNANMEIAHSTFWTTGIAGRAYLTAKILGRYSSDIGQQTDYVCDMRFPKDNKYRKDAEQIFRAVVGALPEYKRSFILAAIASAGDGRTNGGSAGAGLRMFFENMGPAWIKFGQLLSYAPNLPDDIREDLAGLKDGADKPPRWELFDIMGGALPDKIAAEIESVGGLRAGSFWITAFAKMKDGGDKVVSLLRPDAKKRSASGFAEISGAIAALAAVDPKYKSLSKIAAQADENARLETDIDRGFKKYEKARELYGDISVRVGGDEFRPNVADWEERGKGYKLMALAEGRPLGEIEDLAERKKMALGYLAVELAVLLKGDVWDIDRHQGQQNFEKTAAGKYSINIFDTGAQIEKAPKTADKIVMANMLWDIAAAAKKGKKLDAQILENLKKLDEKKNNSDYAVEIHRGLMALHDIIEYGKNPPMKLDGEDLENALRAVLSSPGTDKTLAAVLTIRGLPTAAASKIKNIARRSGPNPVKVAMPEAPPAPSKKSARLDKSAAELQRRKDELNKGKTLGFANRQIKSDKVIE